jgi:TonB family protein
LRLKKFFLRNNRGYCVDVSREIEFAGLWLRVMDRSSRLTAENMVLTSATKPALKEASMAELSLTYRNGMVNATPISDDDEDESPGRVLTVEEFIDRLRNRTDIFGVDKNYRLRNTELLALLIAILAGMLVSSAKGPQKIGTDFYQRNVAAQASVTIQGLIDRSFYKPTEEKKPITADVEGRKVLRPQKPTVSSHGASVRSSASGSIRSRIARTGVLGILASAVRGKDAPDGDMFGRGGFTHGIDAILSGMSGLKQGGRISVARHGLEGIGFGPGFGPNGFDGPGPAGINDLLNALMQPKESAPGLTLKTGPPVNFTPRISIDPRGGVIAGIGRSKSEVLRVVMQNIVALRYAYNKRLREKPGLKGKITIRFAIDEFGNVIHCEVVESSMSDAVLEATVSGKIKRWKFEKIDKPGDITEIVYPFVFST